MMKTILIIKSYLLTTVFILIMLLFSNINPTETTIKYFPIDDALFFTEAKTELVYDKNENELTWFVHSKSNTNNYLRQDISLLYNHFRFAGILNKWQENTNIITLKKQVALHSPSNYQAISFHHGESHRNEETISSVQGMSDAQFNYSNYTLDNYYQQQYLQHIEQLMNYFHLDKSNYTMIPLTQLSYYENNQLLKFTKDEQRKIIGQFWEGLYANYIIELMTANGSTPHYMPVILFANDNSHLLVLYEINGMKEKLIQQINH